MRRYLAITFQAAAMMLLAATPAHAEEIYSNNFSFGGEGGFVTSDCHGGCEIICDCETQTRYSIGANMLWLGRGKVDPNFLIVTPANAPAFSLLHT
jgi:hypothetical protein